MSDPTERDPRSLERSRIGVVWWLPPVVGAAFGVAMRAIYSGDSGQAFDAMMSSFVLLVPVAVGAVTVFVAELRARRSVSYYFGAAALANVLFVFATLLILFEGLICVIVAAPLFAVIGGFAGLAAGAVCRFTRWFRATVYSIAALPLVLGSAEQHVPLPATVDTVVTVQAVAARPAAIWPHLLDAPVIAPEEIAGAWMYRIGAPLPLTATTERRGTELIRHIEMGRGVRFEQVAADWEEGKRVRWTYRFAADSFPAGALDDHVRIGGHYFDLLETEYIIEPVKEGARLTSVMRYRVSTHFNWYARPLARFLVGNFQEHALAFYARRAEATDGAPSD
jgi:hypothetical protein